MYEDADRMSAIKLDELDEQISQQQSAELWERYTAIKSQWDLDTQKAESALLDLSVDVELEGETLLTELTQCLLQQLVKARTQDVLNKLNEVIKNL